MKTKKKQTKMVGRSALMASLIVAAITGVTPAFAATTSDNLSSSTTGAKIENSHGTYIAAKTVSVTGKVTGKDYSLVVVTGGKLHVGKAFDATPGADNNGVYNNPNTTLTTDNMSIEAGGAIEVSNNSTLNILQDKALVEGTLTLNNGTVVIKDSYGTLQVAGNASLLQTVKDSHNNTVKGSVLLGAAEGYAGTGNGKLDVVADSTLTITKDLTVKSGSFADVSGTLNVGGATKSEVDGADGTGILLAGTGKLVINNSSAVTKVTANDKGIATGVETENLALKKVGTASEGTLLLRVDKGFTYTTDYLTALAEQLGMKGHGNVGILGGTWVNASGELEKPKSDGTGTINAPENKVELTSDAVSGSILASTLDTKGTAGTALANSGTITLVGTGTGGNLVTGTATAIANSGTLTLGILGENTSGTLNTTVTNSTADSKLNVEGGSFVINKVVNTDGTISVTNSSTVITELTATKGTLFVDPAFVGIGAVTDNKLGTTILAGAGGNIAIGGNEAWLNTAMAKAGVNPLDPKTSVLGVRATQTLQAGTFVVLDPTLVAGATPTGAAVQLGENSLFVADMSALTNGTALILNGAVGSPAGTVEIDPTATLYLDKLTYKNNNNILFADNTAGGGTSATMDGEFGSILNPDIMLNASLDTPGSSKLTVTINKASKVMNNMSSDMDGLMDEVWRTSENSVISRDNAGKRLVSRAANSDYMTPTEGARVVEGAARMAVVGATQQMAFATSNAATAAATQRTSMANPMANSSGTLTALVREEGSQQWKAENSGLSAGNGLKNGAALWIMPLYQNMNAWNMKADNFNTGYSANFGGVALGGDYTFADAFRVGLALNIGGGFAESNGDFAKTENKFNFWGINLYGGWAQNNMAVTADVGYTSTFNDVKQDTPLNLGMSEFKTDMYSYAITAGLRGEYKVQTEYVDIIPHIAARFTSLHSDDYKIKSGGDTVFKGEAIDQSIWTFPIGVAFSKDVEMSSGWIFKPQLDLAVIPAAGDIAAKSKVKIPGNSVSADLESNIVDGISYQGALGFDMYKDNIAFGINYTIQASEHTTGHGVQATVRYEF